MSSVCILGGSNPGPRIPSITDGREGKTEAPKALGRAFQLKTKEARAAPYIMAGTFLVNFVLTLVMFDLRVSQSFVSSSLCCSFSFT